MIDEIKIKEKEFILRNSNRSLLKFEEITGRSVMNMESNYTDTIKLFWCILYGANRKSFLYDFEDFLDILDEDETLIKKFTQYLDEKEK